MDAFKNRPSPQALGRKLNRAEKRTRELEAELERLQKGLHLIQDVSRWAGVWGRQAFALRWSWSVYVVDTLLRGEEPLGPREWEAAGLMPQDPITKDDSLALRAQAELSRLQSMLATACGHTYDRATCWGEPTLDARVYAARLIGGRDDLSKALRSSEKELERLTSRLKEAEARAEKAEREIGAYIREADKLGSVTLAQRDRAMKLLERAELARVEGRDDGE